MRFLMDECVSPALVEVAYEAGYEAYHVAHRRWGGREDEDLFRVALAHDFVIVTNNRNDFLALVDDVELHPGLIVFLCNASRERQREYFRCALAEIAAGLADGIDMVNTVIEVDAEGCVTRSEIPPIG